MKLRDINLQVYEKTLSHVLLHVFGLYFLWTHNDYSFQGGFESVAHIFFRKYKRKGVLLVIYLINYDSSKSTFFMLSMAFDIVLSRCLLEEYPDQYAVSI